VKFVNTNSNKCLDVQADNPNDGTVVQLFDCNGTNAQRWNPTVIGGASGGGGNAGGGGNTGAPGGGSGGSAPTNGTRDFTFVNHCSQPIWVGGEGDPIAPARPCSAGCPGGSVCNNANQLCTFVVPSIPSVELGQGQSTSITLPPSWGGRFWPRTNCSPLSNGGLACATGDCGGNFACPVGVGGAPPATLAEFTVASGGPSDFYDVSNVDGSNVPLSILPVSGSFNPSAPGGSDPAFYCGSPGCTSNCGALPACPWNLQSTCPPELQDRAPGFVGCRSANQVCAVDPSNPALNCAAEDDLYGCTGGGPNGVSGSCYAANATGTCCGCPPWSPAGACVSSNPRWTAPSKPGTYAAVFKNACPTAYSFPFDDPTSTFTCKGTGSTNPSYTITFCP
jgi:hypothetical protein